MSTWGSEDSQQSSSWRTGVREVAVGGPVVPHLHGDKLRVTTGARNRPRNPGFQYREIKSQNLWLWKSVGVAVVEETPSLTGDFIGEIHRVLEHTQTHVPGIQHEKGLICLCEVGEVIETQLRAKQVALFPFWPFPHIQHHNTTKRVASPWWIPKAPPLYITGTARQKKKWPKWKNRSKLQKKYN